MFRIVVFKQKTAYEMLRSLVGKQKTAYEMLRSLVGSEMCIRDRAKTSPKLATRLSKGEKRNRKRMAEVGTVYDATPTPRTPADILPATEEERREAAAGPVPANKWLMASVVEDAASVVGRIFDEAERRDPEHQRTWVALVDGNNHQIDRIGAEARARKVSVSVVIDLIHVLEYLWKAAWCFHAEGARGTGAPHRRRCGRRQTRHPPRRWQSTTC